MEDIASLMPDSGLENNPVPIETLLGVDDLLPDVLRGVVGGVGTPSVPHPQPASLLCLPGEEEGGAAQVDSSTPRTGVLQWSAGPGREGAGARPAGGRGRQGRHTETQGGRPQEGTGNKHSVHST